MASISPLAPRVKAVNTERALAALLPQSGHGVASWNASIESSLSKRLRQVVQTYSYMGIFSPQGVLPRFYPAPEGQSSLPSLRPFHKGLVDVDSRGRQSVRRSLLGGSIAKGGVQPLPFGVFPVVPYPHRRDDNPGKNPSR